MIQASSAPSDFACSAEDIRLSEHVAHALRETGYPALREVKIAVRRRMIRLNGRVPSYYLKQVAQTTALAVPGIQCIDNDLEVSPLS
jgi:osmotically-inducible protein OsmY